ncbi:MAG TPA: family 43 glycosylhydrolase [bacterium]|uniref:Beta-xylosidase n=1 Tax=candidate division TA06 bacterium ADurb.Bin417 TaxID=1852828 RepID=A0A1V5ML58_UNCT6|nr:MAG: Beta-xylosidase [candidate division TA06 bacterium ADurb.Bin417]HNQ35241.1 family 43 glycosylhydrolase [bacterium]HNS49378.1 family 43 glycosylhydrolase [bacterium]
MVSQNREAPRSYRNPVRPGDFPDPSVVRVGEDYYLANSTFQYFPGIILSHSRDLVNWRTIGHVLTRNSQLDLGPSADSAGIWAPDISWHDGRFWVAYTLQTPTAGLNCLVWAERPEGPYSEPVILNRKSIDPSIFNDDDGRRYLATAYGTLQELAADGTRLLGEPRQVWPGTGNRCPEGPHLVKVRGYYYFMMAEGGTGYDHTEVLARSRAIWGPYEPCPYNPVLKPAGPGHPIQKTGHAKLVLTQRGEWWCVYLGGRPYGGKFCSLGRETFLGRVNWTDDDWFVIEPPALEAERPDLPWSPAPDFSGNEFGDAGAMLQWETVRNPGPGQCLFKPKKGLVALANQVLARRPEGFNFEALAVISRPLRSPRTRAGLVVYGDTVHNLQLGPAGGRLELVRHRDRDREILAALPWSGTAWLRVRTSGQEYSFQASVDGERWQPVGPPLDGRFLAPESIMTGSLKRKCFTGLRIGIFNESDPAETTEFSRFEYRAAAGG